MRIMTPINFNKYINLFLELTIEVLLVLKRHKSGAYISLSDLIF